MTDTTTTSATRILATVLSSAVGWAIGVYAGVFVVLTLTGWNEFADWQFHLATITGGSAAATFAASAAGPAAPGLRTVWTVPAVAALVAVSTVPFDADFGFLFVVGGIVAVVASTVAATTG